MKEIQTLFRQMAPMQEITKLVRERGVSKRDASVLLLEEGRRLGMSQGYLLKMAKWLMFNHTDAPSIAEEEEEEEEEELPPVVCEIIAERFTSSAGGERGKIPMCTVCYEETVVARVLDPYAVEEETTNALVRRMDDAPGLVSHDQIGLRIWPCELFLMEFLHEEVFVRGRGESYFNRGGDGVVLELGAGVGLAGFWCLETAGARRLLLTDFKDSVLDNLRASASLYDATATVRNRQVVREVEVAKLDWRAYLENNTPFNVEEEEEHAMVNDTTLVLAGDAIYDPDDVEPFLAALVSILSRSPKSVALVACTERNSATFSVFLEKLARVKDTRPQFTKRVTRVCTHRDVPARFHYRAVHIFDRGDSVRRNEIQLFVIE